MQIVSDIFCFCMRDAATSICSKVSRTVKRRTWKVQLILLKARIVHPKSVVVILEARVYLPLSPGSHPRY